MSLCPLRTELEELIAGRLDAERHRELDGHIAACPSCQATLETLAEPQDAFLSAVHELATLAVHSASPPLQQAIDRIKLLPHVGDAASAAQESNAFVDHTLGDFRIARQVGRGGMGIVYEAQQISLGRKVALKTLPFAGLLDPRRLQRFQNEARAAASLEHPHIVPVYAVGVDRSVYYYAMRFIDGPNLSEIIDQLRRQAQLTPSAGGNAASTMTLPPAVKAAVAAHRIGGTPAPESRQNGSDRQASDPEDGDELDSDSLQLWADDTSPIAAAPTEDGAPSRPADRSELLGPKHIRRVARHMIEAARALDYAHERGVVHRDIKPSNLMLDTNAVLWITDFGLARIEADPTFSATGEVMGTLRYMSPEQALGKRGVVDHRSDIYSLGVTLYELLTLTPIFPDEPDPVVLAKIAAEDPTPPRQLNRSIPVDLETIVLKAMSKEADERYATASEFADDLTLFLEQRKIKARRRGLADRLARWLRRHPAGLGVVGTAVIALLLMAVGFASYSAVLRQTIKERDESNAQLKVANIKAADALRESKESGERADRALQESRQQVYAQDVEHATRALASEDVSQAFNLLGQYVPHGGESDLRGFEWYWLRSRSIGTGQNVHLSQKPLYDVGFSPDGLRLAAGGGDGVLYVLDTRTGREVLRVPTGQIEINGTVFTPDGKTIATSGDDATIRLWNARDGKPVLCIKGPKETQPHALVFTRDGRQIVSSWDDPVIRIWNSATGTLVGELKAQTVDVAQLALSPDGKTLASAGRDGSPGNDGTARLWNLETRQCRRVFRAQDGRCLAVAFSPDGKLLATGSLDRTIRVWKCSAGTTAVAGRLRDVMHDICFLPSGDGIAAADGGGTIRVWELPRHFGSGPTTDSGANSSISEGQSDKSVVRWQRHTGPIHRLMPDPARNTLASAGNDGTVSLTDMRTGAEGLRVDLNVPPRVFEFTLQPNDELLCSDKRSQLETKGPGYHAWIYGLETGQCEEFSGAVEDRLSGMTLTPDGRSLLLGHHHGKITIHARQAPHTSETWDLHWDTYPKGHPEAKTIIDQLEFAPDGRTLIVRMGDSAGSLRLYDYRERKQLDQFPTQTADEPVVLSRSGRWLAGKLGRVGSLWDLRSQAFSGGQFGSANTILALAIAPDERVFASGGEDRKISLRGLPDGLVQKELIGHQAFVTCLAFSPDGRTLLSGDLAGTVKVWSVQTGRFLCDLAHQARKIERIQFSPSGRYLVYAAYQGPLVVFNLRKLKADD
jgi:WD40 repeat protein/serine/threonine protein kinase